MLRLTLRASRSLALFFAAVLVSGSTFAEKPPGVGGDNSGRHEERERHDSRERRQDVRVREYFGERHRAVIRDYYAEQFRSGRCPPGLAKKHNGCLPPGQAKKWSIGHSLPRDVIFYDLPPAVVMHLGPPPEGHRYVRVATDILLIAIGTAMVADAIEDLDRQ